MQRVAAPHLLLVAGCLPERQTLRPAGSVLGPVSNCVENGLLRRPTPPAELHPPPLFLQDEAGRGDGTVSQSRRSVRRRARLRVAVDVDEGAPSGFALGALHQCDSTHNSRVVQSLAASCTA